MKNSKRFISIFLLCAILLTSFTACQKKDSTGNGGSDGQSQEVQKIKDPQITYLDKTWKNLGNYSEGLIAARDITSGLWGYIDKTGEYVIEPAFYDAFPFSEGLAAVKTVTGFYSFIDKTGNEVIKGNYSCKVDNNICARCNVFKNGYALVYLRNEGPFLNPIYNIIDKKGNIIKEVEGQSTAFDAYENIVNDSTDNVAFDEKVLEAKIGPDWEYHVMNGYIIAEKNSNGIEASAIYDTQLNEIIAPGKYNRIYPIGSEMFIAANNAHNFAVFDKSGKEYLPFEDRVPLSISLEAAKQISEKGYIAYCIKNDDGSKMGKCFDIQTKELRDSPVLENVLNGQHRITYVARDCSYDNEKSGIYYFNNTIDGYGCEADFIVYNSKYESIGEIRLRIYKPQALNPVDVRYTDKEDCIPFLKENIAPVYAPNGGVTLAVIK